MIDTPRLRLTPGCPDDADDFRGLERDPEVMRFLNGGQAVDLAEGDPDAPFLMPRGVEPHVWAARRREGGFVGWFCLWPDSAEVAELGYRLARAEWGQGLAAEGAAALMAWGFEALGYGRIYAGTMAANTGSRRVMEKIGMRYARLYWPEGLAAIAGSEAGEVEYEILRADWQIRSRAPR